MNISHTKVMSAKKYQTPELDIQAYGKASIMTHMTTEEGLILFRFSSVCSFIKTNISFSDCSRSRLPFSEQSSLFLDLLAGRIVAMKS